MLFCFNTLHKIQFLQKLCTIRLFMNVCWGKHGLLLPKIAFVPTKFMCIPTLSWTFSVHIRESTINLYIMTNSSLTTPSWLCKGKLSSK